MRIRLRRYGELLGAIGLLAGCDVKDRTVGVRQGDQPQPEAGTDAAQTGNGGAPAAGGSGPSASGATGTGGGAAGSVATGGRPGAGGGGAGGALPGSGGTDAGPGCSPETDTAFCKRLHTTCGDVSAPDNCGTNRTVTCGSCTTPDTCGAGNTCVPPNCVPESAAAYCDRLGKDCGVFSGYDNCGMGRSANCGTCMSPKACGTDNVCACVAESNSAFCTRVGKDCGTVSGSDNCGAPRSTNCGSCTSPKTCGSNNVCACVPENAAAFCKRLGKECNSVTAADNCGTSHTYDCGTCTTAGEKCGNKNLCVVPLACTGRNDAISVTFYDFTGSPAPTPAGGTLVDGFYASTKITAYGTVQSAIGGSLEIRSGFIRRVHTTYNTQGSALTGWTEAGTYTVAGTTITDTVDNCMYGGTSTQNLSYTSSSNQIRLFDTISGATVVTQYDLQP